MTEWINETVQIARQSNEAHAPVALPGGVTASASDKGRQKREKPVEKTSVKECSEARRRTDLKLRPRNLRLKLHLRRKTRDRPSWRLSSLLRPLPHQEIEQAPARPAQSPDPERTHLLAPCGAGC